MSHWRASWRVLRVLAHLLRGLWVLHTRFQRMDAAQRQQAVQDWSQRMLRAMGVQWTVHGEPPAHGPLLALCNHISWLDILVINAIWPCRFVSKADVRHWPVIGRLAAASGTLFIERENRRDAMRVVHHMAERLQAGDVLAVFPEGTTGDGLSLLPFHANLLQAAVVTDVPVQLLGLRYTDLQTGQPSAAPVYVGDTTLVASIWRTLGSAGVLANLYFGESDTAQGRDRRSWSDALRRSIAQLLNVPL